MKYILLIFMIAFTEFALSQGDAPPLLRGQEQTSKSVGALILSPNNQVTKINSSSALIETGNSNLLTNPSFEHNSFTAGWSSLILGGIGDASSIEESSIVVHGKKATRLSFLLTGVAMFQDSALYASQFADGVQGLAYARVKTSLSGIKLCARRAGVTSTTLCANHSGSGKWELLKVPFILGSSSNGLSIQTSSNGTGDIYIDDAFVGAVDLTQNMSACNSVNCETVFTAYIATNGTVSQENLDFINGNCTFGTTVSCNFNSGVFTLAPNITYMVSRTLASAGACGAVGNLESTTTSVTTSSFSSSFVCTGTGGNVAYTPEGGIWITVYRQGADFTAAKQLSNGNTYSSINSNTDWQSCGHTTSSFTGFGTVSAIETHCKREGGDLLMKGKFISGVSTAVEARVALPVWNGVQLVSKGTSVIPSIQISGKSNNGGASSTTFFSGLTNLIEPSVSYLTFGIESSTTAGLTKQNSSAFSGNGTIVAINARIPIEGWENSNIIIGQFNGLESCTNSYECTDVFSAKVSSAGVVSDENLDFVSGNCTNSSTGVYVCTFRSSTFTVTPNCIAGAAVTGGTQVQIYNQSSSGFNAAVFTPAGALINASFNLICQKQGADYIGKTAKAVASDQNLRTPGVTNGTIYSAQVNTLTGAVSAELGDWINGSCSVITAGEVDCDFVSNKFVAAPNCHCTPTNSQDSVNASFVCGFGSTNIITNSDMRIVTKQGTARGGVQTWIQCHGYGN